MASRFILFSWHLVPVASGHTHTHQLLFVPWQACGGRVEEKERMALAYLTMALGLTAVGAAALVYTKFSLLLYSLDNGTWVSVSHLWSRRDCDGVGKSAQSKLHQPQLDADRRPLCKADEGKSSILIVTDKPWPSSYHHPHPPPPPSLDTSKSRLRNHPTTSANSHRLPRHPHNLSQPSVLLT